jgi:hypothetical protein
MACASEADVRLQWRAGQALVPVGTAVLHTAGGSTRQVKAPNAAL